MGQVVSEEKTEQPSLVKLKEARSKGQVAKSSDLVVVFTLLATLLFLFAFFRQGLFKLSSYLQHCLTLRADLTALMANGFDLWFILSLPVLFVAALAAIVATVLQTGFLYTLKPLKPDVKRLDPFSGIKKIFSQDKLIELIKQVVKFSLVLIIIIESLWSQLPSISLLSRVSLKEAPLIFEEFLWDMVKKLLVALGAVALVDLLWQRFFYLKSLRMSKDELKKEQKHQEGDPRLKEERRRLWQEAIEASSQKGGSFVVINPEHLAIVLLYDDRVHQAPVVLAKGMGPSAKHIVQKARHEQVPIIRNVSLAKDLWWVDINAEIPENLFNSVAEILTFIYELSAKKGA